MRGIRETRNRIGVKKMRKGEKAIRAEDKGWMGKYNTGQAEGYRSM